MKTLFESRSKKGTILEIFLIVVFLFSMAIILPITHKVYTQINSSVGPELGTSGQEKINSAGTVFSVLDGIFAFILIGMVIGACVLAYQVDFIPIFFPFAIIIGAIAVIVTAALSNAFADYSGETDIATDVSTFPIMHWMMDNFVLLIVPAIFIIIIIMFAKIGKPSGGGGA